MAIQWSKIGEILKEIAIAVGVEELIQALRNHLKDEVKRRTMPRSTVEVKVMEALLNVASYSKSASETLLRWHRIRQERAPRDYGDHRRYGFHEEADFMEAMGQFVQAYPEDPARVIKIFWRLAELNDESFDAAIEMLLNDNIGKFLNVAMEHAQAAADTARRGASRLSASAAVQMNGAADALNNYIVHCRAERDRLMADPRTNPRRRW